MFACFVHVFLYISLALIKYRKLFHGFCAADLIKLRDDYEKGSAETKRFLEQKYGKKSIRQALSESYSAEWLEKNAKMCPYCGTYIQVRHTFYIVCKSYSGRECYCASCHTQIITSSTCFGSSSSAKNIQ